MARSNDFVGSEGSGYARSTEATGPRTLAQHLLDEGSDDYSTYQPQDGPTTLSRAIEEWMIEETGLLGLSGHGVPLCERYFPQVRQALLAGPHRRAPLVSIRATQ